MALNRKPVGPPKAGPPKAGPPKAAGIKARLGHTSIAQTWEEKEFTREEIATYINFSAAVVSKWVKQGIPHVRDERGKLTFKLKDVLYWLNTNGHQIISPGSF